MALILGWDTETTGLNTSTDYVLEIGAAIYDTDSKQILKVMDEFILWPDKPVITPEITRLTNINEKIINHWGIPPEEAIGKFLAMAEKCEYLVGHNSLLYDRLIFETAVYRSKDDNNDMKKKFLSLKHLDTTCDINYPDNITTRKLVYLCFEHNIIMQNAHRALFDVFGCLALVGKYSFSEMIRTAQTPLLTIEAFVSYEEREMASSRGFYWQKKSKQWLKKIRKIHYDEKQFNFQTRIVEQIGGFDLPTVLNNSIPLNDLPENQTHQLCQPSRNLGSGKQLPLTLPTSD